jgi:hypothetical protein
MTNKRSEITQIIFKINENPIEKKITEKFFIK